jgi:outer membrane protein, heavy metal efflux system
MSMLTTTRIGCPSLISFWWGNRQARNSFQFSPQAIDMRRYHIGLMLAGTSMMLAGLYARPAEGQSIQLASELQLQNSASIATPVPAFSLAETDLPTVPDPQGMTLQDLEHLACQCNPSIKRFSALVAAARGSAYQAGRLPNPLVGYQGQQIGSSGRAEQHGVQVSQDIIRREKRALDRSIASQEIAQAEQQLAVQQMRVVNDVRAAFYRVLYTQQQIQTVKELKQVADKAADIAKQLLAAEEVAKTDLLLAEVEVQRVMLQQSNLELAQQSAWQQLSAVVGQPLAVQTLEGDFFATGANIDFDQTLAALTTHSPEVLALQAKIHQAQCVLQRQIVEPLPNLSVQGLYNFVDNGIDGKPDAGIAVAIPLPLWNKNEGAIQAARQQLVAAQQQLGQIQLRLKQELAPVLEQYNRAKSQVTYQQLQILPRLSQTLDLTRQAYEAGETSYIAVLTVQREYAQNKLAYLEGLDLLRKSEVNLQGMLLQNSLQAQ